MEKQKTDLNKAMMALSEIYISIYEFSLNDNSFYSIKSNPVIDALAGQYENVQDKFNNVMTNITVADQVGVMLEFSDLSTLNQKMKGKKDISMVFLGKVNGWCRARYVVMDYNEDGSLKTVLHTVECINEEKIRENHLLYLSQTDLMTGICNRGFGEKSINDLIKNKVSGMLVIFDVDKFKLVNDRYGHHVGDLVLIAVADAIRKVAREQDITMRLGGDEFAAYFPGITDNSEGEKIINSLFTEFEKICIEPMTEPVAVSLGAKFYEDGDNFETMYKQADKGVYISKNSKGSSFEIMNE